MPWRHYEGYKVNICCLSAVSRILIFFDATMYLNTCSMEVNFSKYIHIHTPWKKFIENFLLPFQGMFLASSKLLQATQLWMHQQRMQGACRVGGTNKDGQPRNNSFLWEMAVPAGSKDVYQKEIICVYTGSFSQIFLYLQKKRLYTYMYKNVVCAQEGLRWKCHVHWKTEKIYASRYFLSLMIFQNDSCIYFLLLCKPLVPLEKGSPWK